MDEDLSSCNTIVYLSWLLNLEDVLGGKFHAWRVLSCEHENFSRRNVRKHREIKSSDKYVTLDVSLKFDSLDKMRITSSE